MRRHRVLGDMVITSIIIAMVISLIVVNIRVAKLEKAINDISVVHVTNNFISEPDVNDELVGDEEQEYGEFRITAYDNSVESQGKWVNQTATGFNLKDKTIGEAKCIAVDPNVIPLNSTVEIIFDSEYEHLNGEYIARDTGGAIKGNRLDLFMGDGVPKNVTRNFGVRKVKARIVE